MGELTASNIASNAKSDEELIALEFNTSRDNGYYSDNVRQSKARRGGFLFLDKKKATFTSSAGSVITCNRYGQANNFVRFLHRFNDEYDPYKTQHYPKTAVMTDCEFVCLMSQVSLQYEIEYNLE